MVLSSIARSLRHICAGTMALTLATHAAADAPDANWPAKPVTLVAPFTPGGTTDIVARALANQLQIIWKQAVVVDNRPGAGGTVGAALVARANPDGYTLLLANVGHAAAPALYKNLPYDFTRNLDSITNVAIVPNVLLVPKSLPVSNVAELVKYMKERKAPVSYGSAGIGSTQHLSAELLKSLARVDAVHVPYKGAAPMMTDLIGARLEFAIDSAGSAAAQISGGHVKALGVTTTRRTASFPNLPTLDESGLPGYAATTWYSISTTAGTPQPVKDRIYQGIVQALATQGMKDVLAGMSAEPGGMPPAEFDRFVHAEVKRWTDLIKNGATIKE
ncbi:MULTISPECIES: tripartite tricarboxylate transporter substrate binding protein [Delftia]|uniref:Tripartite tricarboxylate transporter substrate binding protein n=3 Tax=Pseudomonadati TaxID=3379134 RepID=A0A2M9PRR4_DELAC|nr:MULTISPECIES: tripartite tricarboxylate transporter substrate binding protein [Delftia]MBL8356532.1 tripartite tricarboxylate transporter substrate binding protein [Delftia acidovorans]PJO38495.1 tripartite tricarboxylate transporter substrate binding protein [Delftia acidovorans]QPS11042.1 tripartite tricarboxylate transporter substrate binding protein [Delftia acidovorans]HBJ99913.1 tripartite tricarboxylate transporter substrate binding protein [Delftia acidovorans]